MTEETPLLETRDIVKRFSGGIVANDHVSFSVRQGEVHGLLGENGAGKTTLMRILYGLYQPDEGEILLRGEPAQIGSPQDAIDAGIGMVHQHFMLIPRLSVVENVILGRSTNASRSDGSAFSRLLEPFRLDLSEPRRRVEELAETYGLEVDPDEKVWQLDVGEQQRVEILKSLYLDVDLLILDEPTAVLAPAEVDQLFSTLRKLVDEGLTVIFITHKLEEVTAITDRLTVLRDGAVVDTVDTDSVSHSDLTRMMVGREVLIDLDAPPIAASDSSVLQTEGLRATDARGIEVLRGVDLDIREGEIVGLAGVSGNGQSELAECIVGARQPTAGTIRVNGRDLTGRHPRQFAEAGVSYIPEDRLKDGCAADLSVMFNLILKDYRQFGGSGVSLDYENARAYAQRLVEEFDVRVPNVDVPAGKLSGGNLQKVILARELSRDPELLVANQPTRGLDVGAIEYVRQVLLDQRAEGTGILLIAEDLDEIMQMSDRILAIYEGEIVHETSAAEADRTTIGRFITEGRGESADGIEPETNPIS